jgi:hypothetical protein
MFYIALLMRTKLQRIGWGRTKGVDTGGEFHWIGLVVHESYQGENIMPMQCHPSCLVVGRAMRP